MIKLKHYTQKKRTLKNASDANEFTSPSVKFIINTHRFPQDQAYPELKTHLELVYTLGAKIIMV
jgi:hypothetical protein